MRVKKNLDVILYEKIKNSFLKGEYELGEKLNIDELADKYEVSRTPIIQAIKRLENEGMLETARGGKVMIPQYTASKIKDIYDVRMLLEEYAMKYICKTESKIDFTRIQSYADKCRDGYSNNDIVIGSKSDLEFHREIVASANNEYLNSIYSKVQGQCMVVNYLLSGSSMKDFDNSCLEHERIIESLKKGNLEESCDILEQHLNGNVKRLLLKLSMIF